MTQLPQTRGEALRHLLEGRLRPGEDIVYAGMRDAAASARSAAPTAFAGILLIVLSLPILWLGAGAAYHGLASSESFVLPAVLAALAACVAAIGLHLAASPGVAALRARRSLMVVTDRRLMIVPLGRGEGLDLPARDILGVERHAGSAGYGTLEVRHEERANAVATVLPGVEDARTAEFAIRNLLTERSITIISPR